MVQLQWRETIRQAGVVSPPWRILAPESLPWVFGLLLLGLLSFVFYGSFWVPLVLSLAVLFIWVFFREPRRIIPNKPLGLVSPVDGRVSAVEKTRAPMLDCEMIRISIRKSAFDPSALRSSTEGRVREQSISHLENGGWRCLTLVETDEGDAVVRVVVLRRFPQRLRLYMQSGERLGQGQRCGFLPLAAAVEFYLPVNSNVKVQPGQRVLAGSTLLGFFVHKEAVSAVTNGARCGNGALPGVGVYGGA